MENNEQYYELRASFRRDVTSEKGWTKAGVVSTEEFYSPETTHALYMVSDELPAFTLGEASYRRERFRSDGYRSIGGVIVGQSCTVDRAVKYHEKGRLFLSQGALLGPYILIGEPVDGLRFYVQRDYYEPETRF